MKTERKTNPTGEILIFAVLIIMILSSGCISEAAEGMAYIFSPSSSDLLNNENYYQIYLEDLTVPTAVAQKSLMDEDIPNSYTDKFPGFELSSYYQYMQVFEGSKSSISVNLENTGQNAIFIYQFGFLPSDENKLVLLDTGITLLPGEEKKLGIISIDVPENTEEIELRPQISLLAQTSSGKWYDYKRHSLDAITIKVYEKPVTKKPEYRSNPKSIFNRINEKVDPSDITVRTMASASAKKYPGKYNIYQVCALFDDTKKNIQYISDPRGKDTWSAPGETIAMGAGDCEDYAILLSSLVEAIGGTSRIYLTDNHAFAAVYIGNETGEIADSVNEYYGYVPVYYTTDQYGSWLLLDPTSSFYAGGLPGGTAPTDDGWTYLNTTTVTAIDIAPEI